MSIYAVKFFEIARNPICNSIAPNPIPQTGDNLAFVVLGMVVLAVGIVIYIKKR